MSVVTINRYDDFKAMVQRFLYDSNAHTAVFYFDATGNGGSFNAWAFCNDGATTVAAAGFSTSHTTTTSQFLADFPAAISVNEGLALS